jgi:hypothetical protein
MMFSLYGSRGIDVVSVKEARVRVFQTWRNDAQAMISLNSYRAARPLVTRRFRASLQPIAITIARYIVRGHGTAVPIEE